MHEDTKEVLTGGNENTYKPNCNDFDSDLGCCKLGDMKICRESTCPKEEAK